MISDSDIQLLKLGDLLILTSFERSNNHHKSLFNNFKIGEAFRFSAISRDKYYSYSRIDLIYLKTNQVIWFSKETLKECFDTIQSVRDYKITKLLDDNLI
jgi:hypothetical protein